MVSFQILVLGAPLSVFIIADDDCHLAEKRVECLYKHTHLPQNYGTNYELPQEIISTRRTCKHIRCGSFGGVHRNLQESKTLSPFKGNFHQTL